MDQPGQVVRLELCVDGDSLRGSASTDGVEKRRFAGWLGLVAAVEALLGAGPERGVGADTGPAVGEDAGDGTVA